jgi:hypothetical protein
VIVEVPSGFLILRLGKTTLSLGNPELSPTLGRVLLTLQARETFPNGPQVDHLRHVNVRR